MHVVSSLNQGFVHWQTIKLVMCYIKGIFHMCIKYKRSKGNHIMCQFLDVDWAWDKNTCRSTLRIFFRSWVVSQHGQIRSKLLLQYPTQKENE
jgi:hypothetical protein